jgi:hypothetical protein
MSDKKISMLLLREALKQNLTAEDLKPTLDMLTIPILDYFKGQTNLAKMYLIANMLEKQLILPLKSKIIEGYKNLNSKESK